MFEIFKSNKSKEEKSSRKFLIYIIDDETEIADAYKELIESTYSDCEVVTHSDSIQGFEELKGLNVSPNVVLCDMNMPGLNGLSLRADLLKLDIDIPFIFISGLEGGNVIDENYTILAKPLDFKLLCSYLDKFL